MRTSSHTYTDFGGQYSENGPRDADSVSHTYTTNQLRHGLSLLQPNAQPWEPTCAYDVPDRLSGLTSPADAIAHLYLSTSDCT